MSNLIIFDLDGTIVNTRKTSEQGLIDYSKKHNLQIPDLDAICYGYSNPDMFDFKWGLNKEEQKYHMDKAFIETSDKIANGEYQPEVFDGMIDTLTYLYNSGNKLAIYTSRESNACLKVLENNNIKNLFSIFKTRDDVINRGKKPKPNPELMFEIIDESNIDVDCIYMVGDTDSDILVAKNAKVKSIAVSWGGFQKKDILMSKNPDYIIDKIVDIKTIV